MKKKTIQDFKDMNRRLRADLKWEKKMKQEHSQARDAVSADRAKHQAYLARKLKWFIELQAEGKSPCLKWLIEDLAKHMNSTEKWYW